MIKKIQVSFLFLEATISIKFDRGNGNYFNVVQKYFFFGAEILLTCIFASIFLRNIFIQVIFPNIITYLDRTFKEEQNDINFEMK